MRVCLEPGCPELTAGRRCAEHARDLELERGTPIERGYDARHRAIRRRWVPRVASGRVKCARCKERISPLEEWHLDHTDDRTGYLGPSHVACNVSAPHKTS